MSNVLHRTQNRYLRSVNTPDYPEADWIINPDLSNVVGYDIKYWVRYSYPNNNVDLMNQTERDALDAQELSDSLDALIAQIDFKENIMRQIIRRMIIDINILRQQWAVFQNGTATISNLNDHKALVAGMADLSSDRTFTQLRTWIRDQFEAES